MTSSDSAMCSSMMFPSLSSIREMKYGVTRTPLLGNTVKADTSSSIFTSNAPSDSERYGYTVEVMPNLRQ